MSKQPLWSLPESCFRPPAFRETGDFTYPGVRSIYYEGPAYEGRKTEIFAFLGLPEEARNHPVPAVVLVHGGGGTAFGGWVKFWNRQGFAALAMDNCGGIPDDPELRCRALWPRHAHSGPAGWGNYADSAKPVADQWIYHAAASVVLGHSLLRSLPGVDPERIGITGVSWGGVLTCLSCGLDPRFAWACPVYGCGSLGDAGSIVANAVTASARDRARWLALFDPERFLPNSDLPMLYLGGTNDETFTVESVEKSMKRGRGRAFRSLQPEMWHGHGKISEEAPEILHFAALALEGKLDRLETGRLRRRGGTAVLDVPESFDFNRAEAVYTRGEGFNADRKWHPIPLQFREGSRRLTFPIPPFCRRLFFNLIDSRNRVFSTRLLRL